MYKVSLTIPTHCNKCPFGHCNYSLPYGDSSISKIDEKENKTGTYGYVCNLEFHRSERYTKVMRADIGSDIQKPEWCGLEEENSDI